MKDLFLSKKDILRRHAIIFLMACLFGYLASINGSVQFVWDIFLKEFLDNFIYISCIWNLNILLMALVESKLNWEHQLKYKIILSASIAVLLPLTLNYLNNNYLHVWINGAPCAINSRENIIFLIIAIAITLLVNSIFVAIELFNFWKKSVVEKEEIKRERISSEFETLKNQVSPHFLFNSLNTLTSLIDEDQKIATDFVMKLSNVYRYVLVQRDKELVTLKEELDFVRSYIFLNKIRFGDNLHVNILLDSVHEKKFIATLALQILVENAIKHNIISKDKPLTIDIGVEGDCVFVKNNLQRKTIITDSSHVGLANIKSRYHYFTEKEVIIHDGPIYFCVYLPLISDSKPI
jgi:hypothetical protein